MTTTEMLDLCIQFVPSASIGLLVGIAVHFNNAASDNNKTNIRHFIGSALTSATLSIAVYGMTTHFLSDDIVKIGLASFAALIGVDRAKHIFDKFLEKKLQ